VGQESDIRPNIVLMVADDHGREAAGCYGNTVIKTPGMDALAREGVRFTNSCCTTASCAASRAVILTGLQNHTTGTYGHTHGAHHFSCFSDVVTLPVLLNQAGYRTGRVGKRHYAPESLFPFQWGMPESEFGRDDVRMSEFCREFIREDGPFFLYWCSKNPHRSGVDKKHPLRIDRFGNPSEAFPGDEERCYSEDEVVIPSFLSDTPEVRAELAQYYQSISRMDRGIVRLMDVLKEEGEYNHTVVIYISDNGAAFPESKTTLYEPGMRLPCIVRSPLHEKRGTTCDGLVSWADLTPTILDFAGAVPNAAGAAMNAAVATASLAGSHAGSNAGPGQFHGRSFRNIIDEESPDDWRDELYAAHTFHEITNYYPMRVVRTKRYKFIYNIAWKLDYSFAGDLWISAAWQGALRDKRDTFGARTVDAYLHRPRFELYDLENDPDETANLAGRPEHRELVESFTQKLKAFQAETSDPWLHKWEYE